MQILDSIVIIFIYNEWENIENIICVVFGLEKIFYILIIEDGFFDGIVVIVKILQQEFFDCFFMIECKGKLGLGIVYIIGFKWVLEYLYEYIFEMDVDFSYNFNDLLWFYEVCVVQGGDVVIGF